MKRRDSGWFKRMEAMVMLTYIIFIASMFAAGAYNASQLLWSAVGLHTLIFILMFTEIEGYLENIQVILQDAQPSERSEIRRA